MKRSHFKRPRPDASPSSVREESEPSTKRKATVYDAVAGRVSQYGLIDHVSDSVYLGQPLRPDEVLFKAPNAPVRYEENDHYFAHTKLPPELKLPNGELLGALHGYISHYYAKSTESVSQKVWKSMDETALIALGILVEETAREIMGETGDLAFTEAANDMEEGSSEKPDSPRKKAKTKRAIQSESKDAALDSHVSSSLSSSELDED